MILLGSEIIAGVQAGDITITDFDASRCGPNSYDLTLSPRLRTYALDIGQALDMDTDNPTHDLTIPDTGLVLVPGTLYLGATNETATSRRYVPLLEGRSSVARLGITVHAAAGVGDRLWGHDADTDEPLFPVWVLEITVAVPVRVYPNRRVCQVLFLEGSGDPAAPVNRYRGKYSTQKGPQHSLMFKDSDK